LIAALVLAGGGSTRMGRPKALLPLAGRTMLATVVARLLESPVDRVVVVLGAQAAAVRRRANLPADRRLSLVVNRGWRWGLASSLRRGLRACTGAEAVVVALGDQPGLDPRTVGRLVAAFRAGAPLAVPVRGKRRGHPVLFARALFPALARLQGDVGAREVVAQHWPHAARIPARLPRDLDTPGDYSDFIARRSPSLRSGRRRAGFPSRGRRGRGDPS